MENRQTELENLVKLVLKKRDRIIPVIGDDAFEGFVNINGKEHCFPLQRWLAEKLLGHDVDENTKDKIYNEGYRGLDLLCEKFENINSDDNDYRETLIDIIEQGVEEEKLRLRKDIKDFLRAGQFEVIATTCPYHILENELNSENKKYIVSCFSPIASKQSSKQDPNQTSRAEETLLLPSIYQIFGDCEGDFVSGEEDLLKFLHFLNQSDTEKGFGASQLVKYIKDKGQDNKGFVLLMPIGCNNLPNWIFRFLWYPFSQDCLNGYDKKNKGGVWYEHTKDENFYNFLKKYKFKTFSGPTDIFRQDDAGSDPVLNRLTDEFRRLQNFVSSVLKVQSSDNGEWDVFISYAKEDETFAKKVYEILTSCCNKHVWLDSRDGIKAGDDYWESIKYGIKHSQSFLFLITDSYLDKAREKIHKDKTGFPRPSGVYQEIDLIVQHVIENKLDGQKGSCMPLILKGTKVTYTDYNGDLHENEILKNGDLEKLPRYKEYEVMRTEKLFDQIQDLICTPETLEEDLVNIFK